jgi:diaminopimelate epimerase
MKFHKYHALGNDYILIDPRESDIDLNNAAITLICDRNYGIGSDGILYGPEILDNCYKLRILNPDGSEAEKSGNGLRIFSRYLWDAGLVKSDAFSIKTLGGMVTSQVFDNGRQVRVAMGKVSFNASEIPVIGESGEVVEKELEANGTKFIYTAATIGNPHCVILMNEISPELAKKYGPSIENNPKFPNRTNVQFLKIIDTATIQIEIWERGAGYTLASGSSSTAAAAVAFKLGLCGNSINVKMQGGELSISFTDDFNSVMTGPVAAVYDGELRKEFIFTDNEKGQIK